MAEEMLKAIVGLGNPGEKYSKTRHNAGFWLIERLCERSRAEMRSVSRLQGSYAQIEIAGERLHLLMPTTFMNLSGRSVRALLDFYKLSPEQILIVHDELDLPAGVLRLKRGGGAGGHNGLKDIIRCIGPNFARLRLGVGHPGDREQVLSHVLSAPGRAEMGRMEMAVDEGCCAIENCLARGWDVAVNQLHSKKGN